MEGETNSQAPQRPNLASAQIGPQRVAIGLLQGLVAWLLLRQVAPFTMDLARNTPELYWSATHPMLFAALVLVTAFIPAVAIVEIGRMRRRELLTYLVIACAAVAGLAAYDLWRDPLEAYGASSHVRVWPSFRVTFFTAVGLFIVNQLLEHRSRGFPLFAHYEERFEDSWMRGFQVAVSVIFAGIFWSVLELGASLFNLIHIEWFRTTIEHNWFRCPALAMAFAAAVQITDVRPALLNGVRNVGLTLLSWLLPVVVALDVSFLVTLLFVGFSHLWSTHHAAEILLWACAVTLLFLNAAYKDGDPEAAPPAILRWACRVGGPAILLLASIATYAIALRVEQYGWTPDRIASAAVATVALVYGVGYTWAASSRGAWMAPLQKVNVTASLTIAAILVILLTPLIDPARISVNSQLRRLARNELPSQKFDYQFLRFDSGRFGTDALSTLASSTNPDVRSRAIRMQDIKVKSYYTEGDGTLTEPPFTHATVYPANAGLPDDFRNATWSKATWNAANCLNGGAPCDIFIVPYGAAGETALIVVPRPKDAAKQDTIAALQKPVQERGQVFRRGADGKWKLSGNFDHLNCPGVLAALQAGQLASVPSQDSDLMVNGVRLQYFPETDDSETCAQPGAQQSLKPKQSSDAAAPARLGPAFGSAGGP